MCNCRNLTTRKCYSSLHLIEHPTLTTIAAAKCLIFFYNTPEKNARLSDRCMKNCHRRVKKNYTIVIWRQQWPCFGWMLDRSGCLPLRLLVLLQSMLLLDACCQVSQLRVTIWTDCLPRSRQSASQTIKLTNQTTTHLMHFNQSTWGGFKTSTAVKHSLYRYHVIFMLSTYEKDLHSRKTYNLNKLEKV